MSNYRYIFSSLGNESVIAEISLFGVFLDFEINNGGQMSGSFKLDQTGISNADLMEATIPGRTFVTTERNGIPIWSGFMWSRTYQSQSKNIQFYAMSFEKFPSKQVVLNDFTRTNVEQRNIFIDLWNEMQAVDGRNLNINIPTYFSTVLTKSVDVKANDFKFYNEVMESIADDDDGFDWYISTVKSGSQYLRILNIGYPTLGAPINSSSIVFEYPGSILNYYQTEAMADAGTHVYVVGSGDGDTMPVALGNDPLMVGAFGWPRWDVVVSKKDIESQTAINSFAAREKEIRRPPMLMINFSLKSDKIPEFGSWNVGDYCKVIIKDPRNSNGLEVTNRIVKWELTPSSSSGAEEATIRFAGDNNA